MDIAHEEQAAEASRLKAIYTARKKLDRTLTQERVAELCGWSGQSVVSQYMNGRIPLNLSALLKFAAILDFAPEEVSPRLAESVGQFSRRQDDTPRYGQPNEERSPAVALPLPVSPIEVWDDSTPLGPDEVELPFYKEVEISAGMGSEVMLETNGAKLRFGKRSLQRKGISPETAACAPVTGNSMEPVLPDGSTVGVDTSSTQIQDGKMYAIDHSGQLRVKLLYRLPGGGIRVRSYNADEYPDERYDADYVEQHIRVIGKVFWYSVLI
ncbi:LexA family transcriptional regulator [Metapseudomonas resinovorans]|uniref:LexA family transcriptional regulator n=1 Tax=Metapseudomonas resinovorans TaxID=53412 RepID=UPI0005666524|nr:helix-turn-helix transcriptional regulator [Pseudomonas resinovorans]